MKTIVNILLIVGKKKLLFETSIIVVTLYGCEVWGQNISRESWRKIEKIQNNLIIKRNMPYSILLIEASISPLEEHHYSIEKRIDEG